MFPAEVREQLAWRAVTFLALRKRWMVGGSDFGMGVPVLALATRMTRWVVGGRRSHPLVSLSVSCWAEKTGRRASAVCSRVANLDDLEIV